MEVRHAVAGTAGARRVGLGHAHGRRARRSSATPGASSTASHAKTGKLLWKTVIGDASRRSHLGVAHGGGQPRLHRRSRRTPTTRARTAASWRSTSTPAPSSGRTRRFPTDLHHRHRRSPARATRTAGRRHVRAGPRRRRDGDGRDRSERARSSTRTPSAATPSRRSATRTRSSSSTPRPAPSSGRRGVEPPEQFGACADDGSIDCRSSADCAFVTGPCNAEGLLPRLRLPERPARRAMPTTVSSGTRELVVSGSKDGSLYARDPTDGAEVWTRAVRADAGDAGLRGLRSLQRRASASRRPLLRGAQRLHAAARVAAQAPDGVQRRRRLDGVGGRDRRVVGQRRRSAAASSSMGTHATNALYVYDADDRRAARRRSRCPTTVTSGPSIVDGTIYVGYGIFGPTGGVRAFALPPSIEGLLGSSMPHA